MSDSKLVSEQNNKPKLTYSTNINSKQYLCKVCHYIKSNENISCPNCHFLLPRQNLPCIFF